MKQLAIRTPEASASADFACGVCMLIQPCHRCIDRILASRPIRIAAKAVPRALCYLAFFFSPLVIQRTVSLNIEGLAREPFLFYSPVPQASNTILGDIEGFMMDTVLSGFRMVTSGVDVLVLVGSGWLSILGASQTSYGRLIMVE
jgi:hypothetical protein